MIKRTRTGHVWSKIRMYRILKTRSRNVFPRLMPTNDTPMCFGLFHLTDPVPWIYYRPRVPKLPPVLHCTIIYTYNYVTLLYCGELFCAETGCWRPTRWPRRTWAWPCPTASGKWCESLWSSRRTPLKVNAPSHEFENALWPARPFSLML